MTDSHIGRALAGLIDHTCLRPDATASDIARLCDEARQYAFHAVCVAPVWVGFAVDQLAGSSVCVCTVSGFPHGNTLTAAKVAEARASIELGAREIDMVMAIGALKDGDDDRVVADIAAVADAVHRGPGALLKVILETALLADDEIVRACNAAKAAGADFVKTSTGFAATGATTGAVRLMRDTVGDRLGVKAAGGIRDTATALDMVAAGATRLGTSASVAIVAAVAGS